MASKLIKMFALLATVALVMSSISAEDLTKTKSDTSSTETLSNQSQQQTANTEQTKSDNKGSEEQGAFGTIKQSLGNMFTTTKKLVNQGIEEIKPEFKQLGQGIKKVFVSGQKRAQDAAAPVIEEAKRTMGPMAEKLQQGVEKTVEVVKPQLERVKSSVEEVGARAKNAAKAFAEKPQSGEKQSQSATNEKSE